MRKGSWGRRGVAVAVVVAVAGIVALVVALAGVGGAGPHYRLGAARTATLDQSILTTGTIEPADEASLNFATPGRVATIDVAAGQKVSAGEVLATLDSTVAAAQVAQAQANLAAAQAKLASDQAAGATSVQLAADQAAITAAQAALTAAQQSLGDTTLASPISGTVAAVSLAVGQDVSGASSASSTGSTPATGSQSAQFIVVGNGGFTVAASVGDTQIAQVKPGQRALVVPDGSTSALRGSVASVAPIATAGSGVPTFPVTIDLSGTQSGLFAGAGAQVSIVVRKLAGALAVPAAAVHYGASGPFVYEPSRGRQVAHKVATGISSGRLVQITSGLAQGTKVVLPAAGKAKGTPARGGLRGGGGLGGILGHKAKRAG